MATIHFVKDGKRANGECVTTSIDVSATAAAESLGRFDSRYGETWRLSQGRVRRHSPSPATTTSLALPPQSVSVCWAFRLAQCEV